MSMTCEKCDYRSYQGHAFCPIDGSRLVERADSPFVCQHVWTKHDSRKVMHCRLPEGHAGNHRGVQIGSDGRRWPRKDWPTEVRSGRVTGGRDA